MSDTMNTEDTEVRSVRTIPIFGAKLIVPDDYVEGDPLRPLFTPDKIILKRATHPLTIAANFWGIGIGMGLLYSVIGIAAYGVSTNPYVVGGILALVCLLALPMNLAFVWFVMRVNPEIESFREFLRTFFLAAGIGFLAPSYIPVFLITGAIAKQVKTQEKMGMSYGEILAFFIRGELWPQRA